MNNSGVYKINFPNGKSYIGISVNIKKRISRHNLDARKEKPQYPVHKAIKKYYGQITMDNVEIIEFINASDKKLMSEREKYWIKYYNTFLDKDKGYNLTPGGDGASEGIYNNSSKLNKTQLNQVYDLLINSNLYIYEIAKKFNLSPEAISNINTGKSYYNNDLTYPLRKDTKFQKGMKVATGTNNHLSKLTEEDIFDIYNLLQNSILSLKEIGEQYNVSYTIISMINRGLRYQKDNYSYPLRKERNGQKKVDNETLENIIFDIINTKLPYTKIAEKYSLSVDTIRRINQGKNYKLNDLNYPLRKR